MRNLLAFTCLSLSLGLTSIACDDDPDPAPTDTRPRDAADGGTTDTPVTPEVTTETPVDRGPETTTEVGGETGAETGGETGAETATETGAEVGVEVAPDAITTVDWNNCGPNSKPGVSAMDFCLKYMSTCGFGAVMGRTAENSFADLAMCITRYNSYPETPVTAGKACAAYHICKAAEPPAAGTPMDSNTSIHCPHPAMAAGPCMLPAR